MVEHFIIPSFVRSWLDNLIELNPKEKETYLDLEKQLNELQKNIDQYFTDREQLKKLTKTFSQDLVNAHIMYRESYTEFLSSLIAYPPAERDARGIMKPPEDALTPRQKRFLLYYINSELDLLLNTTLNREQDPAALKLFQEMHHLQYHVWYTEKITYLTTEIKSYLESHNIPIVPWKRFPENDTELFEWAKNCLYAFYTPLQESRLAKTAGSSFAKLTLDEEDPRKNTFPGKVPSLKNQQDYIKGMTIALPTSEMGQRMIKHTYKCLKYHFYQLYCFTLEEGWETLGTAFLKQREKVKIQLKEFRKQITILPDIFAILRQEIVEKQETVSEEIFERLQVAWHAGLFTENLGPILVKWFKIKTKDPSILKETQKIIFIVEILSKLNKMIRGRIQLLRMEDEYTLLTHSEDRNYKVIKEKSLEGKIDFYLKKSEEYKQRLNETKNNPKERTAYILKVLPRVLDYQPKDPENQKELTDLFWSGEFVRLFNQSKNEDGEFDFDGFSF
ncbi:hypothetical protein SAMN05192529_11513 [Arachidicoccus rhizosphaerae]|uniref:Uncharacterized protein n=1 Tax=Arachidicoccus rhizosphaerae TaxID=551991 RepID=A0A1H4AIJ3_9BACT|nr:hypothetical protein [Arachidicoccus rhizosphaerae]SEA35829.1 hypothetical protein SAMN05192529_11513 [Arachidicoccus rhizosphaerae]